MIVLVGFATAFGVGIWLLFDWCWYPASHPRSPQAVGRQLARVRQLLLESGIADRVQPSSFVWVCVALGVAGGLFTYEAFGLAVLAVAATFGAGAVPVLACQWLRARRRARIQDSLG